MKDLRRFNPTRAMEAAGFDLWLLGPVLLLCGVGLIVVMSASSVLSELRHKDAYYLFHRQCLSLGLGLAVMVGCRFVKTAFYHALVYPILAGCLVLLVLVLLPGVGANIGGNTAWLHFKGLSIQPGELAKLGLCFFLAYSMAKKQENMTAFSVGVLPHLLVGGSFIILIMLERDLGMAAIVCLLFLVILFLGGARIKHLLALGLGSVAAVGGLIWIVPNRLRRLSTFADPWGDPSGSGFQIIHSFMAFGSGGLFGAGVGHSHQKLGYLPEPHTDFIFAILGEELGLVGVATVVSLFLILGWRGFYWAGKAPDPYRRYLASSLTLVIVLQALVNMAVVLGLMPTTGVTLPFISYGGTSLLVNLAAAGILLRLSVELRSA